MGKGGGQKITEVRSLRTEDGGRMTEDGGRRAEIGSRRSDMETKRINSAKDLRVYQKAYALAMEIFGLSKKGLRYDNKV